MKTQQLANEQGWKVAQNVGAGVVGLVIWPVWFGMDFKDAAGKRGGGPSGTSAVSYSLGHATLRYAACDNSERLAAHLDGNLQGLPPLVLFSRHPQQRRCMNRSPSRSHHTKRKFTDWRKG